MWRRLSAQSHHCAGSLLHHRPVVSTRGSHLVPGIVTIVTSVQQTLFLATGAPPVPHTTLGTLLRHNTEGSNHELLSVYPFALHAQHIFCQEIIVEPGAVERRLLHPITAAAEQNSLQWLDETVTALWLHEDFLRNWPVVQVPGSVIIKQRPIRFSSKNNQLQRQMMTKVSLFHYWFWFCWNKKYISISYLPLQPSERMLTSGWERACHSWDEDDEDNKNKTWDIIKQKGLACATIIFLFSYRTHKTDALKSV